jgi:hypothetical protein
MLDLAEFTEKNRFLFHTTPSSNLASIRNTMCLCCVKTLSVQASGKYERGEPRAEMTALKMPDGTTVIIRDQEPLRRKGQLALEPGFSIEDLVEMLDSHIFFWTDEKQGLATSGKYATESRALLRVPTTDLFQANGNNALFSRVNSGGPRASKGKPSCRGRNTLLRPGAFKGPVCDVKEVAFPERVFLPPTTEVRMDGATRFVRLASG